MAHDRQDDAAAREARIKKLRIRSWRRGMKEMDLILGPFADRALEDLDAPSLAAYEALLGEDDQPLYAWVTGMHAEPEAHAPILARLRAFHRI